jgi:hypothetical protein
MSSCVKSSDAGMFGIVVVGSDAAGPEMIAIGHHARKSGIAGFVIGACAVEKS